MSENEMERMPRIPLVIAQAVMFNKSYESCLREFNKLTPEQQAEMNDAYESDPMGGGPRAWEAYQEAKTEYEAWSKTRMAERGGEFAKQGFTIYDANGEFAHYSPDKD